jgi:hypothetical protein
MAAGAAMAPQAAAAIPAIIKSVARMSAPPFVSVDPVGLQPVQRDMYEGGSKKFQKVFGGCAELR